jgi:hypothetical protein
MPSFTPAMIFCRIALALLPWKTPCRIAWLPDGNGGNRDDDLVNLISE